MVDVIINVLVEILEELAIIVVEIVQHHRLLEIEIELFGTFGLSVDVEIQPQLLLQQFRLLLVFLEVKALESLDPAKSAIRNVDGMAFGVDLFDVLIRDQVFGDDSDDEGK